MNIKHKLTIALGTALCVASLACNVYGQEPAGNQTAALPQSTLDDLSVRGLPVTFADPDGAGPLPGDLPRLKDWLIIDLRDDITGPEIGEMTNEYDFPMIYNSRVSQSKKLMLAFVTEERMANLLPKLKQDSRVETCEPDYVLRGYFGDEPVEDLAEGDTLNYPNDPLYKHQWHMEQIGVRSAWSWTRGKGAVVAVIDTGVAYKDAVLDGQRFVQAEDLAQTHFVPGYDFIYNTNEPLDDHAHGTHVAGTIAQSTNNGVGVAGVAPECSIMPIKVLTSRGYGAIGDIADGIYFAADHGANIINLSLGGPIPLETLSQAVKYAHDKGVTVVCAAGNEHRERPSYPAAFPECLSVSAVDSLGNLTWYSNFGEQIDIAAPGGDTRADRNNDGIPDGIYQNTIGIQDPSTQGYYAFQGTSMASPHVAGVCALLASQGVVRPDSMRALIKASATSFGAEGQAQGYGAGLVNAREATLRAGLGYGCLRFCCAALLGIGAILTWIKRKRLEELAVALPTMMLGASGFFFLPAFFPNISWNAWLITPMPAWDRLLCGVSPHGCILFYSCAIPVALAMFASNCRWCRSLSAGLLLGFAGFMTFEAFHPSVTVWCLPVCLSSLWLLLNSAFCVQTAKILSEDVLDCRSRLEKE